MTPASQTIPIDKIRYNDQGLVPVIAHVRPRGMMAFAVGKIQRLHKVQYSLADYLEPIRKIVGAFAR